MKLLHGAVLGALLLSAPAVALAGNGGGGGGLAGAAGHPVFAAVPGSSTNQSSLTYAKAGATLYTDAGDGTQAATGAYQSQPSSNAVPTNNAMPLAYQRGGGH